ncbi:MAG: DUF4254 domain-containing protein [Paludibacteraceae bacterium]|nr:DUF4254 domain-containing protein [Paludibacteraceae bacterium]
MKDFATRCNKIFSQAVVDYHINDNVDTPINNHFEPQTIENLLYLKCWIDTVQWHLEDIIRDPQIDPVEALAIKRRIDKSNQDRTDLVERIDSYFYEKYSTIQPQANAKINTESPAWAIDRLSILNVKIYHMQVEVDRKDVSAEQHDSVVKKLNVLLEQQVDLTTSITQLLDDYAKGERVMKVYKQMKMYNDPALNPVLYQNQK